MISGLGVAPLLFEWLLGAGDIRSILSGTCFFCTTLKKKVEIN